MADSIYTFDPTPASNTTLDTIPYGPNQLYHNKIDDLFRAVGAKLAEFVDDLGAVNTVAGTDTITVTLASEITAYATGQLFRFIAAATNTGAATMNVNSIGAKAIRKISGGTDVALAAGDIAAGETYLVIYRAAANGAAGAWVIVGGASVTAASTSAAGIVELLTNTEAITGTDTTRAATAANLLATRQLLNGVPFNLGLAASVGSNALTIALKGADGSDPSATNPVEIPFRNVTVTTGTPTVLSVTAATSVVVSSGSTLGTANGVSTILVVVGFNDAGTFRLGVINPLALPIKDGIASSTAEGGAGGADTAGVYYTGTAVTSKAFTVLGWLTISEATAGTWASAHTAIGIGDAPVTAMQHQAGTLLAWVNFDGTGTPAIRGSGNVSSITDNGTGDYTVNYTRPLVDANYGFAGSCRISGNNRNLLAISGSTAPSTTAIRILSYDGGGVAFDGDWISVQIFR